MSKIGREIGSIGLLHRRYMAALLLLVILLVVGGTLFVRHEIAQLPEWWAPADADNPATVSLGESTENRVMSEVNRVTGRSNGSTWTLELTQDEINSWLATRLPRWAENQFPNSMLADSVYDVNVVIERDRIRFGFLTWEDPDHPAEPHGTPEGLGQSFSASIVPSVNDQGELSITLEDGAIGQLPVPTVTAIALALKNVDIPDNDIHALLNGESAKIEIERNGGKGKIVLQSVDLDEGRITLGWKTVYKNGNGGG